MEKGKPARFSESKVGIMGSSERCLILRVLERKLKTERRGYSSAGRAPALQAGGQRFDPVYLHHRLNIDLSRNQYGLIAQPVRAHA